MRSQAHEGGRSECAHQFLIDPCLISTGARQRRSVLTTERALRRYGYHFSRVTPPAGYHRPLSVTMKITGQRLL